MDGTWALNILVTDLQVVFWNNRILEIYRIILIWNVDVLSKTIKDNPSSILNLSTAFHASSMIRNEVFNYYEFIRSKSNLQNFLENLIVHWTVWLSETSLSHKLTSVVILSSKFRVFMQITFETWLQSLIGWEKCACSWRRPCWGCHDQTCWYFR